MAVKHHYKVLYGPGTRERTEELTRGKAIRLKCYDCSGGSQAEIANCLIKNCPLYPFRFGSVKKYEEYENSHDKEE